MEINGKNIMGIAEFENKKKVRKIVIHIDKYIKGIWYKGVKNECFIIPYIKI